MSAPRAKVSGPFDGLVAAVMVAGPKPDATRAYLAAHALLPPDPRAIPVAVVEARGRRLFDPSTSLRDKRAILILLAHHGSDAAVRLCAEFAANPDPGIEGFARLALEEAALWAGYPAPVPPRGSCPCGSSRRFQECCGGG